VAPPPILPHVVVYPSNDPVSLLYLIIPEVGEPGLSAVVPLGRRILAVVEKVRVAGVVNVPPEIVIPVNVPAAAAVPPIAGGDANNAVIPEPDTVPPAVKVLNVPAAAVLPPITVPSIVPPLISAAEVEIEAKSVTTPTTLVASLNTKVDLPAGTATPVPVEFLIVTVSASPLLTM